MGETWGAALAGFFPAFGAEMGLGLGCSYWVQALGSFFTHNQGPSEADFPGGPAGYFQGGCWPDLPASGSGVVQSGAGLAGRASLSLGMPAFPPCPVLAQRGLGKQEQGVSAQRSTSGQLPFGFLAHEGAPSSEPCQRVSVRTRVERLLCFD